MPAAVLSLLLSSAGAAGKPGSADQRHEMMAQMEALLADCRPLVSRLEELHKQYASASSAEGLAAERAEVRARLEPMLVELMRRRKSFLQSNRNWLMFGAAGSLPSIRRGGQKKAERSVGSFFVYQGEEKRVRSFLESTESLLVQEAGDFKALEARLQMEREQDRMRALRTGAAAALAAGLFAWGLLGLRPRASPPGARME